MQTYIFLLLIWLPIVPGDKDAGDQLTMMLFGGTAEEACQIVEQFGKKPKYMRGKDLVCL